MSNFSRTFGNQSSPIPLSYLDDNFSQLESASTSTVTLAGAALVGFVQSGSGATATSVQTELRRWVWVEQFGAVGDGSTSDTTAIQAAINTGQSVAFMAGKTYRASGLTQSTTGQSFFCPNGIATIKKNANGVLFSSTGDNVTLQNLGFRGDASSPTFTGDNVNATGANFSMLNCGSRWTSGRAVKSTGGHTQIIGTCDIYQTTATGATDYDIELGVSGTATLYHELQGIYTSQATGGILATDTGGLAIVGGQVGKIKIARGTAPAGVNGGKIIGARILGAVDINESSGVLTGNHFGAVAINFGASTSGILFDVSNRLDNGATITNGGNQNNLIMREVSSGTTNQIKFGDDTANGVMTVTPSSPGRFAFPEIAIPNTRAYYHIQSGGSDGARMEYTSSNNWQLVNPATDKAVSFIVTGTGSGARFQFAVDGGNTLKAVVDNSGIRAGGTSAPFWSSGSGTPEGAVTAPVGSIFSRTDGGAATSFYVKESGSGNTGWVGK